MVFLCMKLHASKPKLVGTWGREQIEGWALAAVLEGGFWRVTGRYEGEQWPEATQYLDLPWAPSTGPSH